MKIINHRLEREAGDPFIVHEETPNQSRQIIDVKYLVIHYTAGNSFEGSVQWLMNPTAKASAHLVISRDGRIAQLGAFNKKLWHAGPSRWANLVGMNNYSIGIELDNCGRLRKVGNGYVNVSGRAIPLPEVVHAVHKHDNQPQLWHAYTQKQLDVLDQVAKLLVKHYKLIDILGHDDIAPFRKNDPGPAFPMKSFRSRILGRLDDIGEIFVVAAPRANFRATPALSQDNILGKLRKGTKLELMIAHQDWFQVYVVSPVEELQGKIGWISRSLLKKA